MSDQVLNLELTNLYNESKKKYPAIRTAAETSLSQLKSLTVASQQELAAQLLQRHNFVDPCILACASRNIKLASSAIVCIQRLVASRGLPVDRLKDVLDALNQCTSLVFDLQLKVLQVLPALAQKYASDLKGDLLSAALQVCAALQVVKTQTISGVATATFQQLVFSAFDKIPDEDSRRRQDPDIDSVYLELDGTSHRLGEAAADGFRVISDIASIVDGDPQNAPRLANLPQTLALDTLWSCLHTFCAVFATHPELVHVLRSILVPFLIRTLSERHSFALTIRSMRLTLLVLQKQLQSLPEECEMLLTLLTYSLDPDAAPVWKRVMCLEVFRGLFATPGLVVQIYMQYDQKQGKKTIICDTVASFVRLATDKPAIIGVGQQSTIAENSDVTGDAAKEQQAVEAAGGVVGVISSALAVSETEVPGISVQWSIPKVACLDNLEKLEPPTLPETYLYSLVIDCLGALAESVARTILPLTTGADILEPQNDDNALPNNARIDEERNFKSSRVRPKRSHSQRSRAVPVNPMRLAAADSLPLITAVASFIDECWPAILATTSTFLNAVLDNEHYRTLVRSFQRFTQVSGLLELSTARDAFLTALSKAAVPANLSGTVQPHGPSSPSITRSVSSTFYRSPKALLSLDSISGSLNPSDKSRRPSGDTNQPAMLSGRNLLCLRALLNLAIAVGPLLGASISIVLQTLRQADMTLATMLSSSVPHELATEIDAVTSVSKKLLALTVEYPNDAFLQVLEVLCDTVAVAADEVESRPTTPTTPTSPVTTTAPRLRLAKLPNLFSTSNTPAVRDQDCMLTLAKIKHVTELNVSRFALYDASETGWGLLSHTLICLSSSSIGLGPVRNLAADILCRAAVGIIQISNVECKERIQQVQSMSLAALATVLQRLRASRRDQPGDHDIHGKILGAIPEVVEACSESLASDWTTVLAALETVFVEDSETPHTQHHTDVVDPMCPPTSCQLVTVNLGRLAFAIAQLICSDFLSQLPEGSRLRLVDLLYRFAMQSADINMSLTTVALYLDLSQHMVGDETPVALDRLAADIPIGPPNTMLKAIVEEVDTSSAAQWLILLHRLSDIVNDDRLEIRHGACQTLMRILSHQAADYSSVVWRLLLHFLFLRMINNNFAKTKSIQQSRAQSDLSSQHATSKVLLGNISALLSKHSKSVQSHPLFLDDWSSLLQSLRDGMTIHSHVVEAAIFETTTVLLHSLNTKASSGVGATSRTMKLWNDSIHDLVVDREVIDDEQNAYVAYCACATEIHSILQPKITAGQIATLSDNLVVCISHSRMVPYGGDSRVMTPLQSSTMSLLRSFTHDLAGVPTSLMRITSLLINMPYEQSAVGPESKFSFVAISKDAMTFLASLLHANTADPDVLSCVSICRALQSLNEHIRRKYKWQNNGTSPTLWKLATSTALDVLPLIIGSSALKHSNDQVRLGVWEEVVALARNISHADLTQLDLPTSYRDVVMVEDDERFDGENLARLHEIIGLALGDVRIPDNLRSQYMADLFNASIIHTDDLADFKTADTALHGLYDVRRGRVHDVDASRREYLAYQCYKQLLLLSSASSSIEGTVDNVQSAMDEQQKRVLLAQAAAPFLIWRFALSIRSYLADQTLRGSCPTPISKVEELSWMQARLQSLCLHENALISILEASDPETRSEVAQTIELSIASGRSSVLHLDLLYPLLVRMVPIAGDRLHGDRALLAKVCETLDASRRVRTL